MSYHFRAKLIPPTAHSIKTVLRYQLGDGIDLTKLSYNLAADVLSPHFQRACFDSTRIHCPELRRLLPVVLRGDQDALYRMFATLYCGNERGEGAGELYDGRMSDVLLNPCDGGCGTTFFRGLQEGRDINDILAEIAQTCQTIGPEPSQVVNTFSLTGLGGCGEEPDWDFTGEPTPGQIKKIEDRHRKAAHGQFDEYARAGKYSQEEANRKKDEWDEHHGYKRGWW